MKIGQMISGRGLDGTARYCQLITQGLAARGHEVVVFHRPGAWIAANVDADAAVLVETSFERRPGEVRRMRRHLRGLSLDVIQTHYSSANTFGMLMAGLGVARVATGHVCNLTPAWFLADRVIAPTAEVARYHHIFNAVPNRRIELIPNFIEVPPRHAQPGAGQALRREMGFGERTVLVGMVGSIVPRKRQADVVRALATSRRSGADLGLVLVGAFADEAALRDLDATIAATGMGEHVRIRIAEPDIAALWSALDIYAFASNFEAGPLSILEAMAAELPVVTTEMGAARVFVAEGETGHVVGPGALDDMAKCFVALAGDPSRRRRMGEAGRARVIAHFSLGAAAARTESLMRAALRR